MSNHMQACDVVVTKVVISVGGWAVLQKTCDLALKNAQHCLQIMLHKKLLESKNLSKQSCQDMSRLFPVRRIS